MLKSVVTLAKSAVLETWNFPPIIFDSFPLRGAYLICVMVLAEPKSRPTHAPVDLVAWKKVVRLPSVALLSAICGVTDVPLERELELIAAPASGALCCTL